MSWRPQHQFTGRSVRQKGVAVTQSQQQVVSVSAALTGRARTQASVEAAYMRSFFALLLYAPFLPDSARSRLQGSMAARSCLLRMGKKGPLSSLSHTSPALARSDPAQTTHTEA
jgi:hypothetical protein